MNPEVREQIITTAKSHSKFTNAALLGGCWLSWADDQVVRDVDFFVNINKEQPEFVERIKSSCWIASSAYEELPDIEVYNTTIGILWGRPFQAQVIFSMKNIYEFPLTFDFAHGMTGVFLEKTAPDSFNISLLNTFTTLHFQNKIPIINTLSTSKKARTLDTVSLKFRNSKFDIVQLYHVQDLYLETLQKYLGKAEITGRALDVPSEGNKTDRELYRLNEMSDAHKNTISNVSENINTFFEPSYFQDERICLNPVGTISEIRVSPLVYEDASPLVILTPTYPNKSEVLYLTKKSHVSPFKEDKDIFNLSRKFSL